MDSRDALMTGTTSDGRLVRRPLSPHLQVYRPQITSVLSISHRFSGIALAVGTFLLVSWLLAAADGPDAFADAQAFLGSFLGRLMLFGWTLALFYHFCNGIRHLAWDLGHGYDLESVTRSGWFTVGAAIGLTLLAWVLGYAVMG
ncbi:succinate dehydrogenase, cytochrome b556 subunit [Elioraea tepida]|jgi:succinate dehydrogenase / fumarate reductase cytochrome b subunit|uniref:Succinate dehydrogenase cytochrome b556 subunit n=1 Tax=Elioraea tepida TaxID=2843330 RepID=A0A975YI91_9PROT|nr:succinate dehydrogenase, cytochrome b556 subunit [Elioraea tepida]QXM23500.1 succinate dehydrogenase, cytochrome b556 subunit [Elioraea tepida]